jgi:hypothetical protein
VIVRARRRTKSSGRPGQVSTPSAAAHERRQLTGIKVNPLEIAIKQVIDQGVLLPYAASGPARRHTAASHWLGGTLVDPVGRICECAAACAASLSFTLAR